MGLRPLQKNYSYSAGIDFRRQNLTSTVDPAVRAEYELTHSLKPHADVIKPRQA